MARYSDRGVRTRSEIISAAHDLFVRQGYHGTSMRQIAQEAGIAPGSLYNHFKNKEAVFIAVFNVYHPYHEVMPALLSAKSESVEEFIREAIRCLVGVIGERTDFLNLMFIEMVEFNSVHAQELAAKLLPKQLEIAQRIQAIDHDQLRELPALILVRTFFGLFFAYLFSEIVMSHHAPKEFNQETLDYFVSIFLHGILKAD